MQSYQEKAADYFGHARQEIAPLLPDVCGRVLEIGCGTGATLAWLQAERSASYTVGIEIAEGAANTAKSKVDEIHCLNFEQDQLPENPEKFNLILCLDVLEHMIDPWRAVDRLVSRYLEKDGMLIISLPNVRHYSVVLPLLLKGQWNYEEAGLLDRTHLRFFTKQTAFGLLGHAQLETARALDSGFGWQSKKGLFNMVTASIFRDLLTYQYILSACKKK